uniref:Uncharacterized protein n=1 Tax=Panagrolaimus sp. PS1159 TaxID=55785 RepID=A0AC35GB83_9BILA
MNELAMNPRFLFFIDRKEIVPIALFYACRHPEHVYIYQEEILKYKDEGIISDLGLAFSRYQDTIVYDQHLIWEKCERLWDLIQNNAKIYVCGDAKNIARDVQNTFPKICQQNHETKVKASQKFFKDLERQHRYQADLWP